LGVHKVAKEFNFLALMNINEKAFSQKVLSAKETVKTVRRF